MPVSYHWGDTSTRLGCTEGQAVGKQALGVLLGAQQHKVLSKFHISVLQHTSTCVFFWWGAGEQSSAVNYRVPSYAVNIPCFRYFFKKGRYVGCCVCFLSFPSRLWWVGQWNLHCLHWAPSVSSAKWREVCFRSSQEIEHLKLTEFTS